MHGLLVNPLQCLARLDVVERHQGDGRALTVDVNRERALKRTLSIVNRGGIEGEVHLQQTRHVVLDSQVLDAVGGEGRTYYRDADVVDAGADVAAHLVGNNQD